MGSIVGYRGCILGICSAWMLDGFFFVWKCFRGEQVFVASMLVVLDGSR